MKQKPCRYFAESRTTRPFCPYADSWFVLPLFHRSVAPLLSDDPSRVSLPRFPFPQLLRPHPPQLHHSLPLSLHRPNLHGSSQIPSTSSRVQRPSSKLPRSRRSFHFPFRDRRTPRWRWVDGTRGIGLVFELDGERFAGGRRRVSLFALRRRRVVRFSFLLSFLVPDLPSSLPLFSQSCRSNQHSSLPLPDLRSRPRYRRGSSKRRRRRTSSSRLSQQPSHPNRSRSRSRIPASSSTTRRRRIRRLHARTRRFPPSSTLPSVRA